MSAWLSATPSGSLSAKRSEMQSAMLSD